MDTILQSLKSISSYPVSQTTLQRVAGCWGLALDGEATSTVLRSKAYNLAEADLKLWLSKAPNVAEGGVTFSFSADERKQFKAEAYSTYQAFDETLITRSTPEFGYQGDNL